MKITWFKKKTTLMIDTNSDPNKNGTQIANTASHQSDLGRVQDNKHKYTTTNRNTKISRQYKTEKIVINTIFFFKFANQSVLDRSLYTRLSQIHNDNYNFTIERNNCKQTRKFVENV